MAMARIYSPSPSDEIYAAIYAVLSKREDCDRLWWISVGLVNDALELDWNWYVNHESLHAKSFCGDETKGLPLKCKPKAGRTIPPCVLENISQACSFRKALAKLDKATMHPESHSQGRISIILWNEFKEYPYISLHQTAYPWLVAKSRIMRSLRGRKKPLLRRDDPSHYQELARACMVSEFGKCSAALVPLLQHRSQGDNAYVGAIIVCASTDCSIWSDLPHIRAVATSLLETRRHLRALVSKKDKDLADLLLDELVDDLDVNQNLFAGKCVDPHCPKHRKLQSNDDKRKRHDHECRLLRKRGFFIGANHKPIFDSSEASLKLQKSLFSFGKICVSSGRGALCEEIKKSTPTESHATTLGSVSDLFRQGFGIRFRIPKGDSHKKMVWPIKPGLLTLVGLYDVFRELNGMKRRRGDLVAATITTQNGSDTVSFAFTLRGKKNAEELMKRLESDGPGEKTTAIRAVRDACPTRPLLTQSRWEWDIINTLNAQAAKKIKCRVEPAQTPPKLFLEWDFPSFGHGNLLSTLST